LPSAVRSVDDSIMVDTHFQKFFFVVWYVLMRAKVSHRKNSVLTQLHMSWCLDGDVRDGSCPPATGVQCQQVNAKCKPAVRRSVATVCHRVHSRSVSHSSKTKSHGSWEMLPLTEMLFSW